VTSFAVWGIDRLLEPSRSRQDTQKDACEEIGGVGPGANPFSHVHIAAYACSSLDPSLDQEVEAVHHSSGHWRSQNAVHDIECIQIEAPTRSREGLQERMALLVPMFGSCFE
jgi:hypothetical protein